MTIRRRATRSPAASVPGRAVIEGADHEIQFTGEPINEALVALWRAAG